MAVSENREGRAGSDGEGDSTFAAARQSDDDAPTSAPPEILCPGRVGPVYDRDDAQKKWAEGPWWVCHCKPRCEKKFAALMQAHGFAHYLPLASSERRYGARIKRFTKPLFPGYVFAEVPPEKKALIYQQDLLARALEVGDVPRLLAQLDDVRALLASGLDFTLRPLLTKGRRVRIISGPLKGLEGFVEAPEDHGGRLGSRGVLLSVDVLQQGLLVPVPLADLKPLS